MTEGSDGTDSQTGLPTQTAPTPGNYRSQGAKERFAVSKFYGMGSGGEWTVPEIADALECSKRQVYRYINESDIGQETREVLATTEAEWRLDMAIQLRREVKRLEEIEKELLNRKQAVATEFDTKTVTGAPTGDRNISLSDDHSNDYRLEIPVPTDFETVTDYGPDLERVQKEKRQYLSQIGSLLGLDAADKKEVDHTLATKHEEVKVVEYRNTDDEYPDGDVIDVDGQAAQVDHDETHESEAIEESPQDTTTDETEP